MLDFVDGQFNEDCSNTEPCDSSKKLICTSNKCLCMSTYYHKEEVCYERMCTDLCIYFFFASYLNLHAHLEFDKLFYVINTPM